MPWPLLHSRLDPPGFNAKFGLYEWSPLLHGSGRDAAQPLVLRPGSRELVEAYRAWPDALHDMRAYAREQAAAAAEGEDQGEGGGCADDGVVLDG